MARPPKDIKWDVVLLRMQCGNTAKQISQAHFIDQDTFYSRFKKEFGCGFSDYSARERQVGHGNIAFRQYTKALEGNAEMLKLLGKEWNGQGADIVASKAPLQDNLDMGQLIMELQHKITILEENANKPKTE